MLQVVAAEKSALEAKDEAQMAFDRAMDAKNESEANRAELEDLLNRISETLEKESASPAEIRTVSVCVL